MSRMDNAKLAGTKRGDWSRLNDHILPALGAKLATAVTSDDVEAVVFKRHTGGRQSRGAHSRNL